MEKITENILLDNGFVVNNHDGFSYTRKDYTIDILYSAKSIKGREWFCVVFTMHNILATMAIQTIEQFNNLMDITEVDFRLKDTKRCCQERKRWNKMVDWKHLGLAVLYTVIVVCVCIAAIMYISIDVFFALTLAAFILLDIFLFYKALEYNSENKKNGK